MPDSGSQGVGRLNTGNAVSEIESPVRVTTPGSSQRRGLVLAVLCISLLIASLCGVQRLL